MLGQVLPATLVSLLKVYQQGLATKGRTFAGADFVDIMCPTTTARIQSMLLGLQPEQRATCSAEAFMGLLRRFASAGMNAFEQKLLGEFVDTGAESPAWVNDLTNINEILALVTDCVATYGKKKPRRRGNLRCSPTPSSVPMVRSRDTP